MNQSHHTHDLYYKEEEVFVMKQVNVYRDESLDKLFSFEEESGYEDKYYSMEMGRSYSSIEEKDTEYLITLTFLEDGFTKLLNGYNVGNSIGGVLCRKKHMYIEHIVDLTMLSITKKHMMFTCKVLIPDLDVINKVISELKSDLSCLTIGKVFKKQHYIEENEFMRLYDKSTY